MFDLDDVQTFAEVAESGGLTAAAERLGLSKSIVSRRLSRLEAALGARLLARTTRGVSQPAAGAAFLPPGKRSARATSCRVGCACRRR